MVLLSADPLAMAESARAAARPDREERGLMAYNVPPTRGIRVPAEELRTLTVALFVKAGTTLDHAELVARLLVESDLRGVFSHGTRLVPEYTRAISDGRVNPRPDIRVLSETSTTQVLDGDGGLGHFPCYRGS